MNGDDIRWIFFDVGETLLSEEDAIRDRIRQVIASAKARGYRFGEDEVRQALERSILAFAPSPMRAAIDLLVEDAEDRKYIKDKDRLTYRFELEKPYPDAHRVLEALFPRYKLGIIANQLPGTAERLREHGLLKYFNVCCASAEVGLSKPDPEFFRYALKLADCDAAQAAMVGDRIDNDIIPAKAVGMRTIRILQGTNRIQQPRDRSEAPHAEVRSLTELLTLFETPSFPRRTPHPGSEDHESSSPGSS
jgi:HAD superfamily hydrolase (TIGR01549 family)